MNFYKSIHAFASTFYFPLTHEAKAEKNKKSLQANESYHNTMDGKHQDKDRRASGNSGLNKLAFQWLNEAHFSNQTFMVAVSLVLRNRQLLEHAKRFLIQL